MSCSQCRGIASFFDEKVAAREYRGYLKKGPGKTTRMLIEGIRAEGFRAISLLDIGGGIGAIQHALVGDCLVEGTSVDASPAYLETARSEAQREGYVDKMVYRQGDFVTLAPEIRQADVVALDRVICCYDDMSQLVRASASKAKQRYGLVFPRVNWLTRIGFPVVNLILRFRRSPFRIFLHAPDTVESILLDQGFVLRLHRCTLLWQVRLYAVG